MRTKKIISEEDKSSQAGDGNLASGKNRTDDCQNQERIDLQTVNSRKV